MSDRFLVIPGKAMLARESVRRITLFRDKVVVLLQFNPHDPFQRLVYRFESEAAAAEVFLFLEQQS